MKPLRTPHALCNSTHAYSLYLYPNANVADLIVARNQ